MKCVAMVHKQIQEMKFSNKLKLILVVMLAKSVLLTDRVMAQTQDINTFTLQIKSLLKDASGNLTDIISISVGMTGIIMVLPTIVKHMRGDAQSSDAFMRSGTGLFMAFIVIESCRLLFM